MIVSGVGMWWEVTMAQQQETPEKYVSYVMAERNMNAASDEIILLLDTSLCVSDL
jgi:hypothetical protein